MKRIFNYLSIFLLLMCSSFNVHAEFAEPDFAFPATVATDAREALERADRLDADSASVVRVRALLELITASSEINNDSIFDAPALIAAEAAKRNNTPAGRAMLKALQASVMANIYQSDRYSYNAVDVPEGSMPEDIRLWGRDNFEAAVTEAVDEALSEASLETTPLRSFAACIKISDNVYPYVPTVEAFVRMRAVQMAEVFNQTERRNNLITQALEACPEGAERIYWLYVRDKDNFQALLTDYNAHRAEEAARLLLLEYTEYSNNDYFGVSTPDDKLSSIALIEESLQAFPDWEGNEALRSNLELMTTPEASIENQELCKPGESIEIKVTFWFAENMQVVVSKVVGERLEVVATLPVEVTGKSGSTALTYTPEVAGSYRIEVMLNGHAGDAYNYLTATPILPVVLKMGNEYAVLTPDFATGAPRSGIGVIQNSRAFRNNEITTRTLGNTDGKGIFRFQVNPEQRSSRWLSFKAGRDLFDFDQHFRVSYNNIPGPTTGETATFVTERSLYHPGDSINWACIVYSHTTHTHVTPMKVLADKKVSIKFYDANNELIDEQTVRTDDLGRAVGSFEIPRGRLSGRFRLTAEKIEMFSNKYLTSTSVTVSDFKLPTVYVENTAIVKNSPAEGAVTLKGTVKTYSGMAISGARISVEVKGARRYFRWFTPERSLGRLEGLTGADGSYEVTIPAEMLIGNFTNFVANVTATTVNAETASATVNFTTGKELVINVQTLGNVNATQPKRFVVNACNPQGEDKPIAVRWEIGKANESAETLENVVLSGEAVTGTPFNLDFLGVPVGTYAVKITADEENLADPIFVATFVTLYNTATNEVPETGSAFFLPDTEIIAQGRKAKIFIGTSKPEVTVYVAVGVDSIFTSVKPVTLRRGFSSIEMALPESDARKNLAAVSVVSVLGGEMFEDQIRILIPEAPKVLISTETFRDRLIPGSEETWRFRVKLGENALAGAAMIATMYNSALDELASYSMRLGQYIYPGRFIYSSCVFNNNNQANIHLPVNFHRDSPEWLWPTWLYLPSYFDLIYDMPYMSLGSVREVGLGNMKMMRSNATMMYDAEAEDMAYDEASPEEAEAEVEEEASPESTQQPDNFEYRDSETLQAFFMPKLVADAEGFVDIVFTVPNANGSWRMHGMAWDKFVNFATMTKEAVASKPVMVMPNLPRFLRQGDTARLGATVFNNSDSTATITTVVEIFDPNTNEIKATESFSNTIESGGSAIVNITVTAPNDMAAIGYRVKSSTGLFADGEQAALPVLSSEAVVVESTQFYLDPAAQPQYKRLPVRPNTDYSIEYVCNPIWTVVKAMRGLDQGNNGSTTTLAAGLYSALAAQKIASECPSIADAYTQWVANPREEALTSMLARNEQLKLLMLNQTPWVQASASNTERMAQLGRIFDSEAVNHSITDKIDKIKANQHASGGFAWMSWSTEPSEWATRSVLTTLGIAHSQGVLSSRSDIVDMCRRAFEYLNGKVNETDRRVTTDEEFALICTLWPEFTPAGKGATVLANTLTQMERSWRNMGTYNKAWAVYILKRNGKERAAEQAFESLRQFGVVRAGQGMYFPSVNDIRCYATIIQAFAAMDAPAETLDAMRQWITVQAQANDDLMAANADYVISSVLLTGSDWTSAPVDFCVVVDGDPIRLSVLQSSTGYIVAPIHPTGNMMSVMIYPNQTTPSYGAIVSVGEQMLAEVQPQAGRDMSINKRFLVMREGRWVETTHFELGEQVRVQLIIQTGRPLQYVTINDRRSATLEPVEQLPGYVYADGLGMYRENTDTDTNLFVSYMPAGTYHLTYDMTANNVGRFISGIATLQSQYAPELTAHSGGCYITVE